MAELIRVEGVRVEYSQCVLDRVDLTIHAAEFVCLVGETGCGKSTLLRLILGSEKPKSGRVLIGGTEIRHPDRNRGYVPQKYSLFPDKTVLGNIAFGPEIESSNLWSPLFPPYWRRRRVFREEAMRYLRSVGLRDSDASKYPDQLSGGMQQRVAIAQALIMKPQVLLMDEAFSALDPATRTDMQHMLKRIWRDTGTTVLFVTHNIAEAIELGTRVVVMGRKPGAEGSRPVFDMAIDGTPRAEMMQLIESAASSGRIEPWRTTAKSANIDRQPNRHVEISLGYLDSNQS